MRLSQKPNRSAFTLVELLVVMTIIIVILALTIGAIGKSFGWVKQKNTEQTMSKVQLRLQRVIDRLYKEADDWPAATEGFILEQASGSHDRARVLKILYLYKWNFPNSYAEAFHNVQESRQLYDNRQFNPANPLDVNNYPGYPPARQLLQKLRSNNAAIPDPFAASFLPFPYCVPANPVYPFWAAGTPSTTAMVAELPRQSSACLLAAFTLANGSPDEFTNNEVIVDSAGTDQNPRLTDAWGTPLLFLRHGNFIHSSHRVGNGVVDRAAYWLGMVKPASIANDLAFAPLEFVLNPAANQPAASGLVTSFYFTQLQNRANSAYAGLSSKDTFDPTSLLKYNTQWRANAIQQNVYTPPASAYFGWLDDSNAIVPWQSPTGTGVQQVIMFRRNFGYAPELAATVLGIPNQAYCPMVILSAGGDKIFSTWDDNLDSYRLQINVSGQQ